MLQRIKEIFFAAPVVEPTSTPPAGELASAESALYAGLGFRPYNPDRLVRNKGGLRVYDEMRHDDQVKACLVLKKYAVLASGWKIEPASADQEDIDIADFVEYSLNKMQGTVNEFLLEAMNALDYGYSVSEIVWESFELGSYAGMFGIKALKGKRPHFYQFDVDAYGNIKPDGLIHQANLGSKEVRLPVNKFVIYSYQKEYSNWYGASDLRAAYRPWWSKDNIIKFWNIYLERFGQPLTIGQYQSGDPKDVADLQKVLANIQSKTSITMPKGKFEISLLEAQRRSTSDYKEALDFQDRSIARSILMPDQLAGGGDMGGAYAKAKVHFDVFLWVIMKLRGDLEEDVMQEQIIRRLVAWNYGNVDDLPKFRFNPLTDDQRIQLATVFADSVQKGAIIPTQTDADYLREVLSFPESAPIIEGSPGQGGDSSPGQGGSGAEPTQQGGMGAVNDTGAGQKKMTQVEAKRALTIFERGIDFSKLDASLKALEDKATIALKALLARQRDALIAFVSSKQVNNKLTPALVTTGIDLKYRGDMKRVVREMFQQVYDFGKKYAKDELPKKFDHAIALTPQEALDYLEAKADFVVSGINDPLLSETKDILLQAIRNGDTIAQTIKDLQDAWGPYLADGNVILDGEQLSAYRLEAIIRTNSNEACNWGRRAIGEDPALAGYVVGYQFSEILDDRTTDLSRYVDGKIVDINSPNLNALTYPLHWNDRGMFVFVTKDDGPVEFIGEDEEVKIISMKNI